MWAMIDAVTILLGSMLGAAISSTPLVQKLSNHIVDAAKRAAVMQGKSDANASNDAK